MASVIANVGPSAVRVLKTMEEQGVHLNPGMLRKNFEGMMVVEDQVQVFKDLEETSKAKLTATLMKDICTEIKDRRMWHWVLLHSAMPEDRVHTSRSMFLLPVCQCLCVSVVCCFE